MAQLGKDVSGSSATGPRSVRYPESGTRLSALEMHDDILSAAEEELERAHREHREERELAERHEQHEHHRKGR